MISLRRIVWSLVERVSLKESGGEERESRNQRYESAEEGRVGDCKY